MTTTTTTTTRASGKKICQVCNEKEAKYKCPKCYLPYCSVSCNKKHAEMPCKTLPKQKLPPYRPKPLTPRNENGDGLIPEEKNDDDDNVLLSPDQLHALDTHEEVQRKFRDDRMKKILRRIDSAKDPTKLLDKEMQDPEFLEFCDDVLEAIGVKKPKDSQLSLETLLQQHLDDDDN